MFDFIIGTMLIYGGFLAVRYVVQNKKVSGIIRNKEIKSLIMTFLLIVISSALFITIITRFSTFLNAVKSPFWFMGTKIAALENFWPNVLVTVAEFNPGSLSTIIAQMGGKLIFFLGLLGILFAMINKQKISNEQKYLLGFGALVYLFLVSKYGMAFGAKPYMILIALPVVIGMIILLISKEEVDVMMAILLVIWFVATTYAALKGVRFTLLMVSAFGVAFGITISTIYRIVSRWISSELKINEIITKTVVVVLLLLVLLSPVKAGFYASTHFMPSVNDAWYQSLTKIKDNSEPDAIINSWWDFGHWFKYIADRRVTLDGSSQGGPPLHWLGKLMVTDDERHSVGILRMLDCGSNNAFDELNDVLNDTPKSIDILDEIVTLDKKEAGQFLLDNGLTKKQATAVLKNTHCEPPEDFFITSEDMVGKAGVWSHFGSWDFKRAEMYTKVKGLSLEEGKKILLDPKYNLTTEQADQYYYEIQTQDDSQWITTWPSYMSAVRGCEEPNSDGIMLCNQALSNGQQLPLAINLTDMDVTVPANENPKPISIVYVTENGTEERMFEGDLLPFSIVIIPKGEGYASLIAHPYLANSIFTRLFYLDGQGLRYFDKFDDQQGVTGGRIIVWKVDWEGTDPNVVYKPAEDMEVLGDETAEAEEVEDDLGNVELEEEGEEDILEEEKEISEAEEVEIEEETVSVEDINISEEESSEETNEE
jgi:dolichyl-diphosphooligosaccharide--protein glycosyltransferase